MGILMLVLRLVPTILTAVATVERLVADNVKGKQKQDAALELVQSIAADTPDVFGGLDLTQEDTAVAVRGIIDAVVRLQNVTKKAKAAKPVEQKK
jgi:hypothetical protein